MSGFDHVFWLGGSPCAGKTSISTILANRFDLDVYHLDEAFEQQVQRFDPTLHPTLTKWHASSWNQRWMQPIDNLVKDVIACYEEHLTLILEDILSLPRHKPLLVEGTALLPRPVASLLPKRSRAIWLVASADFQKQNYSQREWVRGILEQCDNPEVAFHNWMERDAKFARWLAAEVNVLGLELIQVEGTHTIEDYATAVASHFQLIERALTWEQR
jgi:2-phosphoglycerate kinase